MRLVAGTALRAAAESESRVQSYCIAELKLTRDWLPKYTYRKYNKKEKLRHFKSPCDLLIIINYNL